MAVEISRPALRDLSLIHAHGLNKFGQLVADDYVLDLLSAIDLIGSQPEIARARPDILQDLRVLPHRSHLILYRNENSRVIILRIFHSRTNWQKAYPFAP